MFHSIYIMLDNGICVFSKQFKKSRVEDQLLSGFMTALGSFSQDALGSDLQAIRLETGEQLAILKYPYAPVIGIIIADPRDHPQLLSEVLMEILREFTEDYRMRIIAHDPELCERSCKFKDKLDVIMKKRVASRNIKKMVLANLVAFGLMMVIQMVMMGGLLRMEGVMEETLSGFTLDFTGGIDTVQFQQLQTVSGMLTGVFLLIFVINFFIPATVSGYIAGNEKRGILSALLLGLLMGLLLFIGSHRPESFGMGIDIFWWYLIFSPLVMFVAIACGYYGGRVKHRRKLWPLENRELLNAQAKEIKSV